MSSAETIITLGALTLLAVIILNMNRTLYTTDTFLNDTRFGLEEIALATSLIEEISQYSFDEASWDTTVIEKVPSDFTLPQDLGPEADETNYSLFDDFDDFHNYAKAETTRQNIYNILCNVSYVDENNPDNSIASRSYFKKISISIINSMKNDTLTMHYVHGFWYFN